MAYATASNVNSVLSSLGVTLRTDDNEDGIGDSTLTTDALNEATADIDFYLLLRYAAGQLTSNTWVTWACAHLAACILSARRGNPVPDSLFQRCEYYREKLEQIRTARAHLPGANVRRDEAPAVTNMAVDLRHPFVPVRKDPIRSTGDSLPSGLKGYDLREWQWDW